MLGEAAGRVSDEGREAFPTIPWRDVVRLRDRLAHHYHRVERSTDPVTAGSADGALQFAMLSAWRSWSLELRMTSPQRLMSSSRLGSWRADQKPFGLAWNDLWDRYRRERIGARIVEGYRSMPQTDAELGWADESSVQMIAEEPW